MSTYKEIRGLKVRDYTTNPDNPIEGQLWYNTTDNVARYRIPNVLSSWRTGGNLNDSRLRTGGTGLYNAALCFGGGDPSNNYTANTEQYNGSSWTEMNNLNTARLGPGGSGTYTSALGFGGTTSSPVAPGAQSKTESWNGSSWTEVNDLNTARANFASAGADNTSALVFGGSPPTTGKTEEWNGASWVEVADLSTARNNLVGALRGTITASLAFGGEPSPPSVTTATEEWSGSSNTIKVLTD